MKIFFIINIIIAILILILFYRVVAQSVYVIKNKFSTTNEIKDTKQGKSQQDTKAARFNATTATIRMIVISIIPILNVIMLFYLLFCFDEMSKKIVEKVISEEKE